MLIHTSSNRTKQNSTEFDIMKAKIPYKGSIIEVEGDTDEIIEYTRSLTQPVRTEIVRPISKPSTIEPQKEAISKPDMPTKEDVMAFISNKGDDFRHTLKEIELHFLGRTYDGRLPAEKSSYDRIYMRVVNARDILQKTHGGEWKHRVTPTKDREHWLVKGDIQTNNIEELLL